MLVEPTLDEHLLELDLQLLEALRARIEAGGRAPDADAIAMRQLLETSPAKALSPLGHSVLRAVWGRLEKQSGPLTVWGTTAHRLAADRYGLAHHTANEPEDALAAARKGGRAILDVGKSSAWWGRLLAMPDLRVVGALPEFLREAPWALVVSTEASGPTGDDVTFWVTDSPQPESRIVTALSDAGLAATMLRSAGGLKLFVLAGYVQAEDGRLNGAPGTLSGVIGAAPLF